MKLKLSAAILILCANVLQAQTQVWTLQGPSSRHSHSAVWDPTSSQVIIFGGESTATAAGLNDVWLGTTSTSLNDSFTQLLPTGTAPSGRYGHVATYDSASNRMMIFGGAAGSPLSCANDVWILDGANGRNQRNPTPDWIPITPSGTLPSPRAYSAGAYDPNTNTLIIFGGSDCSTGYFNDVWVLSNANGGGGTPVWTELATSGPAPAARESASAVYDPTNNILTVYAGDVAGSPFSDVWVLSNANGNSGTPTWTQLTPGGTAPSARTGHTAVYDSVNNRMTIFGGTTKIATLSDSWVLTAANGIGSPSWVRITTAGTAPSVAYHSAVYDARLNTMYVFAGSSSASKLSTNSHAFTLTNANGLQTNAKWFLGGPPVRYGQSAFYDNVTNSLFVFGGQHSKTPLNFNDYWQASGVLGSVNLKWTIVHTKSGAPSARYGQTGVYDSGSDRLMIFGGSAGTTGACVNDYHVLQFANAQGGTPTWSTVTILGTLPSPRALQASAYDAATNTIIIFGGFNCQTTYFNDVWVLSNANTVTGKPAWTQLNPVGPGPSVREASSAVYDPTTNSLIVFGGDTGGKTAFSDLWILSNANGTGGTPAWTQLVPMNGGPAARSGQTATYDAVNNIMTIYGGFNGTKDLSDLWMLSGANGQTGAATWTQGPSGQPRRLASSLYDPASNTMITFGGSSSINPLDPSSDIYQLSDANGLP